MILSSEPYRNHLSHSATFWLAALILLCAAIASAQGENPTRAALQDSVETLRAQSRYAEAQTLAENLVAVVNQDSAAHPFEITDARQSLATMTAVNAMSPHDQAAFSKADSLGAHADEIWYRAPYSETADHLERQLAIYERLLGPDHLVLTHCLNDLALQCRYQGLYAQSELLYERALKIREEALGPDHPQVASSLNGLAVLYTKRGRYLQSEPLYKRSLAINKKTLGPDHPEVGVCLSNLAGLYLAQGWYAKSEPFYKRALALRERVLGPDHLDVANSLNNLAGMYQTQGQLAQAEPLFVRSLAINEKVFGPDHRNVGRSLSNLAGVYSRQGRYEEAEPLYEQALAIREKALGPDHPGVAYTLGGLAVLYGNLDRYPEAEPLLERSLGILETVFGPDHPRVASALNTLAMLHRRQGVYSPVEPLYERALAIREKALGPDHPDVVSSLVGLAELHLSTDRPDSAAPILVSAADRFESARLRIGRGIARATYQMSPYPALAVASLASGAHEQAWPATEKACGRALADLLLTARRRPLTEAELAHEDSLVGAVKALEPRLATLIRAAHRDGSAEAQQRVESTRVELLAADARWSEFAQAMTRKYPISEGQSYPLERVQAVLGEDQAVVGWLDYEIRKDEYLSWAYVVREQGPVTWVNLPSSAGVASASPFDQARACYNAFDPAEHTDISVADFSEARFQPLLSELDGIEDLIVIPTGAMATIPVEALMDEQGRRLVDRFTISYAPSATIYTWLREERREPRPTNDQQVSSGKTLLLGDPPFTPTQRNAMMFEEQTIAMATTVAVDGATLRGAVVGDELALAALPRLRGTRVEVRAITDLADEATVLLGPEASEQAIVELAESGNLGTYRTLHVATHALVDQERPERSCLVLSRVGLPDAYEAAIRGERIYDGRLTVQEVLQEWELDADLVTLSACETGLGQDVQGEGLVGFAHAFLQAGARSLLVSLWKVDDQATSLLMTRFYTNLWQEKMPKAAALREAKNWLREYVDEMGQRPYMHPYFWSAFILIGGRE